MGEDDKTISSQIEKTKKKLKKVCCCGVSWFLLGVLLLVAGIALLAAFAKYWSDDTHWERGLAYTGVVFVLVSILMIGIGITFCVALYILYKRINRGDFSKAQFKPPVYTYGNAPYPQQPQASPVYTQVAGSDPGGHPAGTAPYPPSPGKSPTAPADVSIAVEEHHKF